MVGNIFYNAGTTVTVASTYNMDVESYQLRQNTKAIGKFIYLLDNRLCFNYLRSKIELISD